jgi:hypothetical protein
VVASYSSRWSRSVSRAYWLPPWGIGNGLDAETWAEIAEVSEGALQLIMESLYDAGIPAHAARKNWYDRGAPFRIWVGTWYFSRAENVIGRALLRMRQSEGRSGS